MKKLFNSIIKENPTFVLLLGLCPALAVTTKFENAYLMGICVLFILLVSNTIISIIKKLIPENVKIPCYILIIGTTVTITEIILKKYIPDLYNALGIYLPLIVVNCIVLGRALLVASKESVYNTILDSLGIGIGFTLSISLIALIREILGTNTLTIMDATKNITGYIAIYKNILPNISIFPIPILVESSGAFLTLGLLLALFNKGGKK